MAKILVVDDDLTVQLVLEDLLQSEGHEVSVAQDGKEALLLVEKWHPDVMICDWMMPYLDGIEVLKRVKAKPELASTFFILLTAREQLSDRIKGLDAGADEFLSKPIETEELLARVRAGLRSRQLTQQLSLALQNLQKTQAQLVQSEKMSSLGQLVAGIAHEINNPVTFIYGNLSHVQSYASDLIELLQLYEEMTPNPPEIVREKLQAIDKEFLINDLHKVIGSMRNGADRIRQIVVSLQDFSQSDRSGWQMVNVHEQLDNTLFILQHRLHASEDGREIQVVKEYTQLPAVECYAGQLNQAFLNIFNNAIDALEMGKLQTGENYKPLFTSLNTDPAIRIRTEMLDDRWIKIRIIDNGPGMSSTVQSRIFDPFFTNKPVGQGTGLGLAICYQIIVSQHEGVLRCFSQPGQGAEFCIELPIRQKHRA